MFWFDYRSSGMILAASLSLFAATAACAQAPVIVEAGPGTSDVSPHQLVRNSKNVLYAVVPDCPGTYPCGANRLHVYQGASAGVASSYLDADSAHAPAGFIRSTAIAIDGHDRIHVIWNELAGRALLHYAIFDTRTNLWGRAGVLQATNFDDPALPTAEGVALALDAAGNPHAVWSARGPARSAPVRLWYSARLSGRWSTPQTIDDQAIPANGRLSLHPATAFTAAGDLVVTWLQGSLTATRDDAYYTPDGTIYVRTLAASTGAFGQTTTIPDLAMTTIDNGPSIMITPDGTQHLTFDSGTTGREDQIRYWYNTGAGWMGDRQPPAQVTHDPSLGPDGHGGIRIYGHGAPPGADYSGYGLNLYSFEKPSVTGAWSAWTLYTKGQFDCSVSTRWSQFFDLFPQALDIVFWSDPATPLSLYVGTTTVPGAAPRSAAGG